MNAKNNYNVHNRYNVNTVDPLFSHCVIILYSIWNLPGVISLENSALIILDSSFVIIFLFPSCAVGFLS